MQYCHICVVTSAPLLCLTEVVDASVIVHNRSRTELFCP